MALSALDTLATTLAAQPIKFVGGKGGVGKTTTAAALASHYAMQAQKTLIVSTDPAHSLGDVLCHTLTDQITTLTPYLDAIELNPDRIVDAHFAHVERTITGYTSPEMMPKIRQHLRLSKSAPGATEAAMLEAMCEHLVKAAKAKYRHIIFDTAPTGHTLRLLVLPEMMAAWTDGLLLQQRRQAKLRSAATHLDRPRDSGNNSDALTQNPFAAQATDRWANAVAVLERRKALFRKAGAMLHDRTQTAIVLVMTADTLPLAETKRAVEQLEQGGLTPAAIVVNQLLKPDQRDCFWQTRVRRQQHLLDEIECTFSRFPLYPIYLQQTDVRGIYALSSLLTASG